MSGGLVSRLYHGQTKIDFVGKRKLWYAISALLILVSVGSLAAKHLNYGIEFKGGVQIQAPISDTSDLSKLNDTAVVDRIRTVVGALGATDAQVQVQTSTDGNTRTVVLQSKAVSDPTAQQKVVDAVATETGATPADVDSERIGSKWGGEITKKAVRALIIFMIVIVAFISYRFEWKMAFSAFVALIHDLVITAGVYSLIGFEVSPSTVIAILTILGYSLYDTIVVFDKVEENTTMYAATGKMTYQDSANLAMNQVFMRSLNTSLATLLPVAALLFIGAGLLGASTLKDLALALFVGILVGTYSSIFVATPVLTQLKEREPRYRNIREKVLRDAKKAAASTPSPAEAAALTAASASDAGLSPDGEEVVPVASVAPARKPASGARPAGKGAKARAGSKKAKRRKRR